MNVVKNVEWQTPPEDERWYVVRFNLRLTDDGGYEAVSYNLPGCATCGDTLEEIKAFAKEAARGCLEEYLESGTRIPWDREARCTPGTQDYAVTVKVKVPNRGGK